MTCFVPDEDVPLKANGSLNSKHLRIDYEQYKKVPRESDYDAEMSRILHNWLAKVHGFEITSQWHLEESLTMGITITIIVIW
ncbi:9162_t:CDS:2 [Funneliformis caledonium]|uniref:9162_t:CDS:1 n=1 Tax=Funneliformis caledonium TaxID=1117310 RepID=A0A9N8VXG4_9GLOM|nr:9162_t:CDS:2 [Funneliformis caledonium]